MPKRKDLKKILVVGAGPIIIGQACEFDYSGTQACKALRDEGYKVILINSNPATIMTDPDVADKTYIEPITLEVLAVTSSGKEYNEKVRNWGLAAVVMIGGVYYGEVSAAGSDAYWVGFVVAMAAYIYLMRNLQAEGMGLKGAEADQFEKIKNLILVGWIIYPLGYLAPVAGDFDAIREVLYTIADIINKVGLGVLVLGIARIKSGEKV